MEIPTVQADGSEVCVMPPEYEEYRMRRLLWQEHGLHYEDTPNMTIAEIIAFGQLEQQHPYRFQRAQREAQRKTERN